MKKLIAKLQNELTYLQDSVQKETTVLLKKLQKLHLKENLEGKKHELEKLIERKYKTFLPACNRFANELRGIAKNAGINVDEWEKNLLATTSKVTKTLKKNRAKIVKGKEQLAKKIKNLTSVAPGKKVAKKKTVSKKATTASRKSPRLAPRPPRKATSKNNLSNEG